MEIAFCRIDDRLIHGQVATVWTKVTGCNRIMCCSDEVAKDDMRKKLLLQVAPPGIKAYVVPVEKACEAYKNPKYDAFKTLFLFTKPADVVRAVKGGIPFKSVNLGGMTYKDGDTLISSAVAVNPADGRGDFPYPRVVNLVPAGAHQLQRVREELCEIRKMIKQ